MNWIRRIRALLGAFWYRMFDDQDFLLGVEFLHGLFYKLGGYSFANWFSGMFPMFPVVYPNDMPFVVLLDADSVHREWYTWMDFVNGVAKGTPQDLSYLATDADGRGWVVDIVNQVPEPDYMMNHLYQWTLTLKNGPDFKFSDSHILFYQDPASLGLPSVKVTDTRGNLKVYWKLICIRYKETNDYTAVSGFMSPELNSCANIVWDIHQNGATYYNTKKLLGAVTSNVICDEDGAISDSWSEQGWNLVRIGDRIYSSKSACNFSAGADVKKGDILFGDMKFYKGSQKPSASEIPGIRVRTDAGELVAENTVKNLVHVTGTTHNILPLTGDLPTLVNYLNICLKNSYDPRCPYIDVKSNDDDVPEGQINPYDFVMRQLRRGRTCAVRLTATSVAKLEAAIQVLRKSTNLGGLITMYVKDTSDTANVTVSGFTADAGMGVVAVDATVTIQGQAAEARILP